MAKQALTSSKIWFDSYDLSTWTNSFNLLIKKPLFDVTGIDAAGIERIQGLMDVEFTQSGFGEDGEAAITGIDYNSVGNTKILSVSPAGGILTSDVFFTKVCRGVFKNGGKVGDVYPYIGAALGNNTLCVLGKILATGEKTSSSSGTGQELGAVATGQKIYGCVHCTANTSGGDHSIAVKIQSCATLGGVYTDRITFSSITPSTLAVWGTPADGEITDTYWKAAWTIAGTSNPSFTIHVMGGIL